MGFEITSFKPTLVFEIVAQQLSSQPDRLAREAIIADILQRSIVFLSLDQIAAVPLPLREFALNLLSGGDVPRRLFVAGQRGQSAGV